jgi:hypothetical protein
MRCITVLYVCLTSTAVLLYVSALHALSFASSVLTALYLVCLSIYKHVLLQVEMQLLTVLASVSQDVTTVLRLQIENASMVLG